MDFSIETEELWGPLLQNKDTYLEIIFKTTVEQRSSRTYVVGHDGQQEEGRVVGKDIIKQF